VDAGLVELEKAYVVITDVAMSELEDEAEVRSETDLASLVPEPDFLGSSISNRRQCLSLSKGLRAS